MKILLDTNVLSETRRRSADSQVMAWLGAFDPPDLWLSVITLGELTNGVARLERREPERARSIAAWIASIRSEYAARILDIDVTVAEEWGRLSAIRTLPVADGLLAATASARGLTLATRNTRDFAGLGIALVDPWRE